MNKQHERSEYFTLVDTYDGTRLLGEIDCDYCKLSIKVSGFIPSDSLVMSHCEYWITDYSDDMFPTYVDIGNISEGNVKEQCSELLDQCGCVPGSPFSARVRAMIESVEE